MADMSVAGEDFSAAEAMLAEYKEIEQRMASPDVLAEQT